jgi:Ca2+-binding RTX toxin-like protein
VTVDDSADTTGRGTAANPVTLGTGQLSGLTPDPINYTNISTLTVDAGSGSNYIDVTGTSGAAKHSGTTLNDPNGTVVVGSAQGIDVPLGIKSSTGHVNLIVDDSADTTGRTATVGAGALTGLAPGTISYSGLSALTVDGGTGTNAFSVTGTPFATTLNGGTGNDTVTIGTLQNIRGGVAVTSASGTMALTVNDGGDPTGCAVGLAAGALTGLPGGTYSYSGLRSLTVDGGTGGNTFTVSGMPAATTINSGTGSDAVVVPATSAALTVNGQNGADTVTIGDSGSVQGIQRAVTVGNASGSTTLVVDDSTDATGRGTSASPVVLAAGALTNLAPAAINYSNLSSLTVNSGSGGNVFSVTGTPAATTLNSGTGGDTVTVQATSAALTVNGQSGADTVTIGSSGGVQSIAGAVTVTNAAGSTALTVDDSADATGRGTSSSPVIVGAGALTNLAPTTISYSNLSALTVDGGSGGNVFSVTGMPATTTLNSGTGNDTVVVPTTSTALTVNGQNGTDTVTVGNSTNGVQSINGSVTVGNQQGATALTVDDSADTTRRGNAGVPVTFDNGTIIGLAPQPIAYSGLSSFTIDGGSGGNAFAVNGTPAATTLNSGTGSDLVIVRDTADPLTVNGQKGTDTVYLGDIIQATVQGIQGPVSITNAAGSTGLTVVDLKDSQGRGTASSPVVLGATSLTNLAPATIGYSGLGFLAVDAGAGGNIISVTGTPAATRLIPGSGINTVTVQATTQPLTVGGLGTDTINVQATGAALTIDGHGRTDTVTLGSTGTVQNITGPVAVSNSVGSIALTVDDSADPTGQTATLSDSALVGLAPAPISYVAPDVVSLLVKGGLGGNTFTVSSTSTPTTLDSGRGDDVVNVAATDGAGPLTIDGQRGHDIVTITNNGSVQSINGTVLVQNTGGLTDLVADDSQDGTGCNVSFSSSGTPITQMIGLAPAPIELAAAQLNSLTARFGSGNDIVDVSGLSNLSNGLLDGGGGTNTLVSTDPTTANNDYQLSDGGFTRSGGGVASAHFAQVHFQQASLTGGTGDHVLDAHGFSGSVTLNGGGAGDDTLIGGSGINSLVGGTGEDSIYGGSGTSILKAGSGDATLVAGSGHDTLIGGPGNDSLVGGSGSTVMTGGAGNNTLVGGNGSNELLESCDDNFTLTNTLLTGTGATPFSDVLLNVGAANLTDTNTTGVGRKLIATAFSGNVTLTGGTGNDTLMGGAGNNVLSGGRGTNTLIGGKGTNTVSETQAASFTLTNTKLTAAGVLLTDTLTGIQQAQLTDPTSDVLGRVLNASAFKGNVTLTGGGGADTLIGSLGNDSIDGGTGGGIFQASGAVNFNFMTATTLTGLGTYTLNSDLHNVRLTITSGNHVINAAPYGGNATLQGGAGNDTLIAGTGTDNLNGGGGNNVLLGGGGSDTLAGGGSGRNLLIGGTGTDLLTGGTGDDLLIAGKTNFDSQTRTENFAAVNAIMAEWTSKDSYGVRVARLTGTQPGGKNGATRLTSATVFSSADTTVQPDTLTGGLGADWFLCKAGTLDTVTDYQPSSETRTTV